jgi:alkylated DNA repair dioxygenase AlkB
VDKTGGWPPNLPNLLPRDGEVFYWPGFLQPSEADHFYQDLLTEVQWRQEPIRMFGKQVLQPRQTAWYGEEDYSYSGIVMRRRSWTARLDDIKNLVQVAVGLPLNGVLLNHYRNGQDSMGWHRDNEKELGPEPVIASVSLGESRRFLLRHRTEPSLKVEQILEHGSLLVMRGQSQEAWEHSIPKSAKVQHARLNLTFRRILRPPTETRRQA